MSPYLFALHANVDVWKIVLFVCAGIAGLGIAYFLSVRQDKAVARRKREYDVARMSKEVGADLHAEYFADRASGDVFGALGALEKMAKLVDNPTELNKKLTTIAENWLERAAQDPKQREALIRDLEHRAKKHGGDATGTVEAQLAKLLAGLKDETVVPTLDGKTVTVPTHDGKHVPTHTEVHHHYHGTPGDAAAKSEVTPTGAPPAPPAGYSTAPAASSAAPHAPAPATHGPVTVNVHPAPASPVSPPAAVAAPPAVGEAR